MLSRIADSLFWMNRYMERTDGILRLTSTHYILGMDKDNSKGITWRPVLELFAPIEEYEMTLLEQNAPEALKKLLIDGANTNSIRAIINRARENARGAQDHLTKEVWEEINQIYHLVNGSSIAYRLDTFQALDVMKELTKHSILYAGTIDITMPRGSGWYFMSLGRYMERCLQTIVLTEKQLEIMNVKESGENDVLQWRYLLFALSGYELHLKTYSSANHNYNVLHQVVMNENFAHSISYSLKRINHYVNHLVDHQDGEEAALLLRNFGRLYSSVRYLDLTKLQMAAIAPFLAEVKADLFQFSSQLGQYFFSYT